MTSLSFKAISLDKGLLSHVNFQGEFFITDTYVYIIRNQTRFTYLTFCGSLTVLLETSVSGFVVVVSSSHTSFTLVVVAGRSAQAGGAPGRNAANQRVKADATGGRCQSQGFRLGSPQRLVGSLGCLPPGGARTRTNLGRAANLAAGGRAQALVVLALELQIVVVVVRFVGRFQVLQSQASNIRHNNTSDVI